MARNVLVPIDGTPLSSQALEWAFTNLQSPSVTAIHVQNPADPGYGAEFDDETRLKDPQEHVERVTRRVRQTAETVASELEAELEIETVTGDPAREVVEYATEHDVDHIVLGSHGRTGRERLLLGSVSENVVRRSPATVTVVRAR